MLKKRPDIKKYQNDIKDVLKRNKDLIGMEVHRGIITRTQKGLDYNNKSFKAYKSDYAKKKGSSKVNLTDKQNMLNAIRYKQVGNKIKFYFGSKVENAKAHGNQIKNGRKFFGMDDKLTKKVGNIIRKNLF